MVIARPLRLQPHAVPKVWGGAALRGVLAPDDVAGASWPDADPVGEVLLVSDQDRHASVVSGGPFAGRSLRGLMLSECDALMGEVQLDGDERFPLVLKLVEARTNLSIQVHPDEAAALKLGVQPKSECWYLLDADPGAEVFLGLAPGVDATAFASGASTPDVVDLLGRFSVRPGDGVDVSPGVVHGMGAGLVLAEVQLNSTTTYRLYDWDRVGLDGQPRETHLDEALRSIDFEAAPAPPGPLGFLGSGDGGGASVNQTAPLRRGKRFEVDILDVHDPEEMASPGRPTAILVLSGSGRLEIDGVDDEAFPLTRGCTWVLPADLSAARIVDADGELRVLRARPMIRN
ncbi:MAG: class I mannose-6-phosphate isomerase [Planctomycetota bacterium]|nr:class I mannose-6-phosphate isomerase [Planctomycetota bacterium]MDG1984513.1 class I mannose-6-phosphate isomerase [Planctomycetota bacterium]